MNSRKRRAKQTTDTYAVSVNICRLVSKHPCLYDRTCPDYMRQMIIKDVWKKIAKEANKSVKICQHRWRNIRASYARSMKNHGANTYYLKNELQFLNKHIMTVVPAVPSRGRRSGVNSSNDRNEHKRVTNVKDELSSDESEDSDHEWAGKRLRLRSNQNIQPSNGAASRVLDFDDAFLQGIRPEMQKMNFNQKLQFKRRVYDLLGDIFTTNLQPTNRSEYKGVMPPPLNVKMELLNAS